MPRRETRGFLERRRARRAPVAAEPERGDAPGSARAAAAARSRYANDVPRQQVAAAEIVRLSVCQILRLERIGEWICSCQNRKKPRAVKK